MDSSVLPKDEIWFLRLCHHISNTVYQHINYNETRVLPGSHIPYWLPCLLQDAFPGNVLAIHVLNASVVSKAVFDLLRPFLRGEMNRKVRVIRNRLIIVTNNMPHDRVDRCTGLTCPNSHLKRVTITGTRCCTDTICPPEDEHYSARNM